MSISFAALVVLIVAILIGIVLALGFGYIVTLWFKKISERRSLPYHPNELGVMASVLFGIISIVSLIKGPVYNSLGEPVAIVDSHGKVLRVIDGGRVLFRWDKLARSNKVIDISPAEFICAMALQPITANPKVRPLKYGVTIEAVGTAEARVRYLERFKDFRTRYQREAERFVNFHLYEFDEHKSKELAKFYNPIDVRQQERFGQLIHSELDLKLAEVGLRIKSTYFDLKQ